MHGMAFCSAVSDQLLKREFGGDLDLLLAWWRGERRHLRRGSSGDRPRSPPLPERLLPRVGFRDGGHLRAPGGSRLAQSACHRDGSVVLQLGCLGGLPDRCASLWHVGGCRSALRLGGRARSVRSLGGARGAPPRDVVAREFAQKWNSSSRSRRHSHRRAGPRCCRLVVGGATHCPAGRTASARMELSLRRAGLGVGGGVRILRVRRTRMSARAWARSPLLSQRCPGSTPGRSRRPNRAFRRVSGDSVAGRNRVRRSQCGAWFRHRRHATAGALRRTPCYQLRSTTQVRGFSRFALNALLVTLLDDDEPPRWSDVALSHICGPAAHVEVNGRPLLHGSVIPAAAFTVRWSLDQCTPLEAFELSGVVELLVFHEETGLSAVVVPHGMLVSSAHGTERLSTPFAASMSLVGRTNRNPELHSGAVRDLGRPVSNAPNKRPTKQSLGSVRNWPFPDYRRGRFATP